MHEQRIQTVTDTDYEIVKLLYGMLLERELDFSEEFFHEFIGRQDQHLAMAVGAADKPLGLICWTVWPEGLSFPHKVCFIQDLIVALEYRKHGIGSAMLVHVKDWAIQNSIRVMHLQTSKSENLGFFHTNGYAVRNDGLYQFLNR